MRFAAGTDSAEAEDVLGSAIVSIVGIIVVFVAAAGVELTGCTDDSTTTGVPDEVRVGTGVRDVVLFSLISDLMGSTGDCCGDSGGESGSCLTITANADGRIARFELLPGAVEFAGSECWLVPTLQLAAGAGASTAGAETSVAAL